MHTKELQICNNCIWCKSYLMFIFNNYELITFPAMLIIYY